MKLKDIADQFVYGSKLASDVARIADLLKSLATSVKDLYELHQALKGDMGQLAKVVNHLVQIEAQKVAAAKASVEWIDVNKSGPKMVN